MDQSTIEAEYKRLGYENGWVSAMTPLARLYTAETMIIGLNPGGEGNSADAHYESENDNGYYTGDGYPNAVQTKARALHDLLHLGPDDTFAAQYIPFRSGSFASLPHKADAHRFADKLWSEFWQIVRLLGPSNWSRFTPAVVRSRSSGPRRPMDA